MVGLYVVSMLASTLLFSFVTDPQQRYMFAAVSVVFVFFVIRVPVGVAVYWITTNLWTVVQQGFIKRTMGHMLPAPAVKSPKSSGGGSGQNRSKPRRKPSSEGRSKRRR